LYPNEVVQFSGNLPSNVTADQRYFVISTNLTTNTFQFSATRGGTAIQPNTTVSSGVGVFSAFVVLSVTGTATKIDVDSSGFAVPTASMYTVYPNSITCINNFRTAALLTATHLQAQIAGAITAYEGRIFMECRADQWRPMSRIITEWRWRSKAQ
jgi:hypothetical protein